MTEIIIIAAVAKNNIIGNKNSIPWSIKEDFQRFKDLTMGHPCIMGDITYLSLPEQWRPLPGRENIVCTFDKEFSPQGTTIFYDFNDSITYVNAKKYPKAYITGGASIYRIAMKIADTLELTRINKDVEGDTLFPQVDPSVWHLVKSEPGKGMDRISDQMLDFTYDTYRKKR